jgi:hypothetical protein
MPISDVSCRCQDRVGSEQQARGKTFGQGVMTALHFPAAPLSRVHVYVPVTLEQSALSKPVYVQSLLSLLFVRETDTLLPLRVMASEAVTLHGGPC